MLSHQITFGGVIASATVVLAQRTISEPDKSCGFCWSLIGVALAVIVFAVIRAIQAGLATQKQSNADSKFIDDRPDTNQQPYDAVIIGAGVVGASVAAVLGKQGKRVLVVESNLSEPHRIVGELLQPSGYYNAVEAGLGECFEGYDAQVTVGYGVVLDGRAIQFPYPEMQGKKVFGRAFHNGRFVMALRKAAAKQPSVKLVEGTVTRLMRRRDQNGRSVATGFVWTDKEGKEHVAPAHLTVVCDGCLGCFRDATAEEKFSTTSYFLGLVLRDCPLPAAASGNVILAEPSPILVYPISSNEVRMLIDFPTKPASGEALFKHLRESVLPQLPAMIRPSFLAAVADVEKNGWPALSTMPNRKLYARPNLDIDNLVMLGDSLNMRHPLTGGGMTVGLTDVLLLKQQLETLSDYSNHGALNSNLRAFYTKRSKECITINVLADALYHVMSARFAELREGCFRYLGLGSIFTDHPVELLSGMSRSELKLYSHFFAVAFYGLGLHWTKPARCVEIMRGACNILLPLIARERNQFASSFAISLVQQFVASPLFYVFMLPASAVAAAWVNLMPLIRPGKQPAKLKDA